MFVVHYFCGLLAFTAVYVYTRATGYWFTVFPFVLAVAANGLIVVAQAFNRGPLGFPLMGEPGGRAFGEWTFGPLVFDLSFYTGGSSGHPGRSLR